MEIITGYVGKKHVTSEQERDINQGIVGPGSYVLKTGMQMEAEVSSNNEIKIRDGVLMHQGCAASIKKNTYDSLTIINGSQGMKRIDLIVARYEKNRDDETERLGLKVIQGTPTESNPAAPEYTEGSIQAGDYIADMPMYQVIINGLNITEVKRLFEAEPDIDTLKKEFAELNGKMENQKRKWTKLCEIAGNQNSSKTFTVEDLSGYSEILLTCGPAVIHQTGRILGSSTIPIKLWNACNTDYSNGYFQSTYGSNTYIAGVTRLSDTSVKLYANSSTLAGLYVR
ncbi:hypothetical protein [Dorea sp. AF36-15AT]|uniref:hypothetical protein n=1 Tax=Dorea sp. AF36-15AT TaxID=2292041 RepID=UPI000E54BE0B|nr:hypothetical protein [Dorea sp. AF36-15AT]RHP05610.1 hypothetical protein DWZ93_14330 [Dorea sp. AF36-15AT]